MAKEKKTKKASNWLKDFKAFITRGNVVDMAVGVIMGSAFGAIVTAFTNILLSVCTWGVPGGLAGLVTVLPALNETQKVPTGITVGDQALKQFYTATEWANLSQLDGFNATISGMYKSYGGNYYYSKMAIIDWGSLINAVISFLIIALTLFMILKIYSYLKAKAKQLQELQLEAHYQKHPEDRPKPVEEAPKGPTEIEVLTQIKELLESQKNTNISE